MQFYFLDTSAVVKRYVQEEGTAWLRNLTAPESGNALFVVRLTEVELTAALARRRKGQSLTANHARDALQQFHLELVQGYRVVEINAMLVRHAGELADRHSLRAYDAVQMAAALEVRAVVPMLTLVSADAELNAAASVEGLIADDPSSH